MVEAPNWFNTCMSTFSSFKKQSSIRDLRSARIRYYLRIDSFEDIEAYENIGTSFTVMGPKVIY